MLGWLKHRTAPVPEVRPVEDDEQKHQTEDRLERLLDRLGSDSGAAKVATDEALHQLSTLIPSEPPEGEGAADAAPAPTGEPDSSYLAGVDPDDYREALPLLRQAVAAVGGSASDDSHALANKIVEALRDRHGFTPDLLADIRPYLDQFIGDVHAGVVRLDEVEDTAIDAIAAAPLGHEAAEPLAKANGDASATAESTMPPAGDIAVVDHPVAEVVVETGRQAKARLVEEPAADAPVETKRRAGVRARKPRQAGETIAPPAAAVPPVAEPAGGPGRMLVIAVCSQKGGAGKTTIAAHLAVRAGMAGHGPAVLIDTDPQGSLGEWWRARNDDTPALATVKLDDLAANLAELRSYGTAIAIIDTPPALTTSIEQVIAIADLVVIPARPSPHDLRAVGATVEMARRAGKPFLFIVNGAAPRAAITAQAVAALSEHGRVVPVILYQRTDFAASMIDGRTVMETAASSRSAQEIAELWQYVYDQIGMRVAA